MYLAAAVRTLPFILFPLLSCEKGPALFPAQCNCDIEVLHISEPSLVTYQVFAHDEASVSSITYQTKSGKVTKESPTLPFRITIQLDKGDSIALVATGNPKEGSIVLGYEVQEKNTSTTLSSSVSRVWVLKDGLCQ